MQVLVLCLNPAVDVEWRVDHVHWEEKNTVLQEHRWAGGKGVNVARWTKFFGHQPRLLIPLGGAAGKELQEFLREDRIALLPVKLNEASRANIVVTEPTGRQIRFNQIGPRLSRNDWRHVHDLVARGLRKSSFLICSGSLPGKADASTYARMVRLANQRGVRSIVDCDGPSFAAAVKARPFLVKPNEHELALWRGTALRSDDEILAAARALSTETHGWVLVSRGAKGAMLVNSAKEIALSARAPRISVRNTVGAGDAFLSGAISRIRVKELPDDWLRWSIATGSACAQQIGGKFPSLTQIRHLASKIVVQRL